MVLPFLALIAAGQSFQCDAIALHDVDGPIHCADGRKIRLQGLGALETDGSCRPNQPCIAGDPMEQRRVMATRVLGAMIVREDPSIYGQARFARPVTLSCVSTGQSYERVTAICRRPDGADVACQAIRARVAARWVKFDRGGRLLKCDWPTAKEMVRRQMKAD